MSEQWDAEAVRELRRRLGLTQAEFAERVGTRQQTVSEWETGASAPRRMSRRLLRMVAEDAGVYDAGFDTAGAREDSPQADDPDEESQQVIRLADRGAGYTASAPAFPEATLTALWLLGRVPEAVLRAAGLDWPVLRHGRAGRGPGPDVREATFVLPSGATLTGEVEVHLRASDFARHGHDVDPAYAGVVLHLCWEDDRPEGERGRPTPLPPATGETSGGEAPTVALGAVMREAEVERLVALGPSGAPPCADAGGRLGAAAGERVRAEGRKRLAERTWRAWRLANRYGFGPAFRMLLERAVASTAGRLREDEERRALLVTGILDLLGAEPVEALARVTLAGRPTALIEAVRAPEMGTARAAEVAWNAALPVVSALAAAYDDVPLARATAALAEAWPSPRPYGRTRALASAAGPAPRGAGALYAQGLLHLQDLWCSRGGCGLCPLSEDA